MSDDDCYIGDAPLNAAVGARLYDALLIGGFQFLFDVVALLRQTISLKIRYGRQNNASSSVTTLPLPIGSI